MSKPKLIMISQTLPFPGKSGQQQRVAYMLKALRERFHVTFCHACPRDARVRVEAGLADHCDRVLLLPSRYHRGWLVKLWYKALGFVYSVATGLKWSNFLIGRVELTPARLQRALDGVACDLVVFEYWHAWRGAAELGEKWPVVLDMHNILWEAYQKQLDARRFLPAWYRRRALALYRLEEECSWRVFDGLIAINDRERAYVAADALPGKQRVFYAPMGISLEDWPDGGEPLTPPRLAYYGGLGTAHNQRDALRVYRRIMPAVWERFPQVDLWIVGSKPPPEIAALAEDDRVTVTGFVEDVAAVLQTMTMVVIPWVGRYGFRSRVIEVLALGVPVITTTDAVYGMELAPNRGLFLEDSDEGMVRVAKALLVDPAYAREQGRHARHQAEKRFSFQATYGRMALELEGWLADGTSPTEE